MMSELGMCISKKEKLILELFEKIAELALENY